LANRAQKLKIKNSKAARALLLATAAVAIKPVNTPAVTPQMKAILQVGSCARFFSTAGCKFGSTCDREHGTAPAKGSPEWLKVESYMKRVGLTPTAAFSQ
jgi:hypothetical protein